MRAQSPAAIAVSLCLALVAPAGAAPEKPSVRIAVGGKATLYYLPLTLAERLGYFRDEGLEVEVIERRIAALEDENRE